MVQKKAQNSSVLMASSADVGAAEDVASSGHRFMGVSSQLANQQRYQYQSKNRDHLCDNGEMLEKSRLSQSGTRKYGFQQQLKPRGSSAAVSRRAQSRHQRAPNDKDSQLRHQDRA